MFAYSLVAGEGVELTVHKESVVIEKIMEVELGFPGRNYLWQKL